MSRAKTVFLAILAAMIMAQPVLACCLVHAEAAQQQEAPEVPPCHGHSEANADTEPASEPDTCDQVADCSPATISQQNVEIKTAENSHPADPVIELFLHLTLGDLLAASPVIVPIGSLSDAPFVPQTPISLKERLLI
jgi:hypothetical protein